TAAAGIGARIGRMRESGRAPMVEARSDPYDLSKGRSFLMSESTTAASWLAGSLANLANSVPPHVCPGRCGADRSVRKAAANQEVRNLAIFTAPLTSLGLPL